MAPLWLALALRPGGSAWPVVSAEAEAAYLSSQLHRPVKIPKRLASHLLYIRRGGSDPKVELKAVAAALRARVTTDAEGYSLVRTVEDDRKFEDVWATERAKWIEDRVKRAEKYRQDNHADEDPASGLLRAADIFQTAMESFGTNSKDNAFFEANTNQLNPSGRLMLDAIRAIGVPAIARLRSGSTTIFETDPRGNARNLPNFNRALQRYEDLLVPLQSFKIPASITQPVSMTGMLIGVGQPAAPVVCARLSVSSFQCSEMLVIEAFGENGALLAQDNFTMSAVNQFVGPEAIARKAMSGNPKSEKVPLPQELRALAENLPETGVPVWMQKPVECEPLSAYASFAMDRLVGPEAECAAVDMCDGLVADALISIDSGQLNLDAFKAVIESFDPYEKVQGQGFVAWRPADPFAEERLDRKDLQRFVQSALAMKYVDVRAVAKAGDPSSRLLLRCLQQLNTVNSPSANGLRSGLPAPGILRFVGAINDADWGGLMSGRRMTAGQMGATKNLLRLFDEFGISVDSKELPARYQHPAELYKGGQFDQTPIQIFTKRDPVFRMASTSNRQWTQWAPQSLGVFQVSISAHVVNGVPTVDKTRDQFEAYCEANFRFQTGILTTSELQIGLPGGDALPCPLPRPIEGVSTEFSYSDLPRELRDRTWELVCRAAIGNIKAKVGG